MLSRNYNKMNNIQYQDSCSYANNNPFYGANISAYNNCVFDFLNSGYYGSNFVGNSYNQIFTKYNGTTNWNAMVGFELAKLALNFTGMFVGNLVSRNKEDSEETINADVKDLTKLIDTEFKKLGDDIDEDNYKDYDVKKESWYTEKSDEIKKNILTSDNLESYKSVISNYETATKNSTSTEITKDQYDLAKEKVAAHEQALKDEKDLEKKANAEKAKANKVIAKIDDLIEKRDNAIELLENKQLSSAIGKERKLISDAEYNAEYEKLTSEGDVQPVFTKAHLKKAASKYKKAETQKDKETYSKQFKDIYTYLLVNNEDEITSDMQAIYKIIKQ